MKVYETAETSINPFRPAFGMLPPEIIGRQDVIDRFLDGINRGVGHPVRSSIIVGARGVGKTVMLNRLASEVSARGYIAVQVTVNPALLEDIIDQINEKTEHLIDIDRVDLRGISAFGFGVELTKTDNEPLGFRQKLTNKLKALASIGIGVVFFIDEVHAKEPSLRTFVTSYQHLLMDERDVAVCFAGLPSAVSDVLSMDVITFLRRANRFYLGNIDRDEVAEGVRSTIVEYGKSIEDADLRAMAYATDGYPFLIQMIGFDVWEASGSNSVISSADVSIGTVSAIEKLTSTVFETSFSDISPTDKKFLAAMAALDTPAKISDIARLMNKDLGYISKYRARMLSAGMVVEAGRGLLDFSMPHMKEYINEHE